MAKKNGRPRIVVDWLVVEKLAVIQCTQEEVAAYLGCSLDTLERDCKREKDITFAEFWRQKRKTGIIQLRRKQWEVAMNGDKTLLIWLGKQYLDQADEQTIKVKSLHEQIMEKIKEDE